MSHHASKSQKKRAETRMPVEEDPEFQIAPMIDILLVLLVFFMSISSTEVLQTNSDVRLPVAKDAKDKVPLPQGQGQMIVNLLWNGLGNVGSIDVDDQKFDSAKDLGVMLGAKLKETPEFRMLVRADKDVRYEFLRTVLLAAANNGVKNVTFSVVDQEDPAETKK
jgi:biopolymer transport protein ExbD